VARLISREMVGVATLDVPLIADAAWGESWLDAK
jgi:DNA polymerase I-like protein with 3'-5' exonuclease and polymerase domains